MDRSHDVVEDGVVRIDFYSACYSEAAVCEGSSAAVYAIDPRLVAAAPITSTRTH